MYKIVAPSSLSFLIPSKMLFLLCGSTATVGSSKNIILGLWATPQAILRRLKRPPDSCFG